MRAEIWAFACLCALSTGCARVTEGARVATHTTLPALNAAPDPTLVDEHCPFGAPERDRAARPGAGVLVTRAAYALEHDSASKIAFWVCASLAPELVFGDAERKNRWKPDPDLDGKPRAVDSDYKGSGYQRGHMVASEDRVATQEANDSTFFLSNAVPQNGPLNGGQWAQLEATIRSWVDNGVVKDAKMVTGGFFYDPDEDDPKTADGVVNFKQVGAGKVAVPTHIFKLVVGHAADGSRRAIAFVAENRKPRAGWNFQDGIVAIDWLEERTGLNFMPGLDPADEVALEGKPSAMWGR